MMTVRPMSHSSEILMCRLFLYFQWFPVIPYRVNTLPMWPWLSLKSHTRLRKVSLQNLVLQKSVDSVLHFDCIHISVWALQICRIYRIKYFLIIMTMYFYIAMISRCIWQFFLKLRNNKKSFDALRFNLLMPILPSADIVWPLP